MSKGRRNRQLAAFLLPHNLAALRGVPSSLCDSRLFSSPSRLFLFSHLLCLTLRFISSSVSVLWLSVFFPWLPLISMLTSLSVIVLWLSVSPLLLLPPSLLLLLSPV